MHAGGGWPEEVEVPRAAAAGAGGDDNGGWLKETAVEDHARAREGWTEEEKHQAVELGHRSGSLPGFCEEARLQRRGGGGGVGREEAAVAYEGGREEAVVAYEGGRASGEGVREEGRQGRGSGKEGIGEGWRRGGGHRGRESPRIRGMAAARGRR